MPGVKILVRSPEVALDPQGNVVYAVHYTLSSPVNGVIDGGVTIPVNGVTETEISAAIQQSVADHANLQTSNVENFTVDDVRGGRL